MASWNSANIKYSKDEKDIAKIIDTVLGVKYKGIGDDLATNLNLYRFLINNMNIPDNELAKTIKYNNKVIFTENDIADIKIKLRRHLVNYSYPTHILNNKTNQSGGVFVPQEQHLPQQQYVQQQPYINQHIDFSRNGFWDRLFTKFGNILTPLTGGQKYNRTVRIGSDKNNLLLELIRDNQNIPNSRFIFFDDTQSIIDSAKELGISVVKIDRSIGFSRKSFNPLLNQINDYNKKQLREKPFVVNGPNLKLEIKAKNKNRSDSDRDRDIDEEDSIPQSYDQKFIKESRYKYDKKNYNTNSDKDPSEYVNKLGIEHFEDLNSSKSSKSSYNFIEWFSNFKIDERYVNLINIIAVIFIIIYGYIWWHKRL